MNTNEILSHSGTLHVSNAAIYTAQFYTSKRYTSCFGALILQRHHCVLGSITTGEEIRRVPFQKPEWRQAIPLEKNLAPTFGAISDSITLDQLGLSPTVFIES